MQARAGSTAYARRYATWGREAQTIVGLADLDGARNINDVNHAASELTWNENLMAADDQGNIGYWHPGLIPIDPKGWDERLPYPGTGSAEWQGLMQRRAASARDQPAGRAGSRTGTTSRRRDGRRATTPRASASAVPSSGPPSSTSSSSG